MTHQHASNSESLKPAKLAEIVKKFPLKPFDKGTVGAALKEREDLGFQISSSALPAPSQIRVFLKSSGILICEFHHQVKGDKAQFVELLSRVARRSTPNLIIKPITGPNGAGKSLASIQLRNSKQSHSQKITIGSIANAPEDTIRHTIQFESKYPSSEAQLLVCLKPVLGVLRNLLVTDCCLGVKLPAESAPIVVSSTNLNIAGRFIIDPNLRLPSLSEEICFKGALDEVARFINESPNHAAPKKTNASHLGTMLPNDLRRAIDNWMVRITSIDENLKGKNPVYPSLKVEADRELLEAASAYIKAALPNSQFHDSAGRLSNRVQRSSLEPQVFLINSSAVPVENHREAEMALWRHAFGTSEATAANSHPRGELTYWARSNGLTSEDISRILPILAKEKFQNNFHLEVSRGIKWNVVGSFLEGLSTQDLKTLVNELHLWRENLRQEVALRLDDFPPNANGKPYNPPRLETKDFIVCANRLPELREKLTEKLPA